MLEEWFESEQEGTTSGFLILGSNSKKKLCATKKKQNFMHVYRGFFFFSLQVFFFPVFFFSRGRVIVGLLLVASVKHRRIPKLGFAIPKFDSKILIGYLADQRDTKRVPSSGCAYGTRSAD